MFTNTYDYNINLFTSDESLHDGCPKYMVLFKR